MYNTHHLGFGAPDKQLVIVNYAICPFTRQPQLKTKDTMASLISLFVTKTVAAKLAGEDAGALIAAQIFLHCS